MRHVVVRRAALLIGTIVLGCAVGFAWLVSPRSPVPPPAGASDGALLFQEYCGSCHTMEELRPTVSPGRRQELERFLAAHGDASDPDDMRILDYLAAGER
jgi:hypothetical protein